MITNPYELTPVEEHEGILLKREDLFQPFGEGTVNGGKLRQCYLLLDSVKDSFDGCVSCCSVYSPQAPITAAVANHFGMPCQIFYGGTTPERLYRFRMPVISARYGAELKIVSKSGIHSILYNHARKAAEEQNLFVVDYGFNIVDYENILLEAVSMQVKNIPDKLDNLVVTCGSGITTIGIVIGLHKYEKEVKNIFLVCTAPDRSKFIQRTLQQYGIEREFVFADLFHQPKFKYENGLRRYCDGIQLHPNYEAKSYDWIVNNQPKGETLLWVVGSKPMR